MNRWILAVVGLGAAALGTLAAAWVVVTTPTFDDGPASFVVHPVSRDVVAQRREAPVTEPPVASPATPASPFGGASACLPGAGTPSPAAPVTAARRPAITAAPVRPVAIEKRQKPRIVAAVKEHVSQTVALLLPARRSSPPAVARVDHRYDGVLTPAEIGRIKGMLRLSSDQEPYWPPIADLLRTVGKQQTAAIQAGQPATVNLGGDLMRFYFAARPLLQSLREDQKIQVRRLARQMGFSSVASYI